MSEIKYIEPQEETALFADVCQIIDGARGRIATYVNTEACLTNWYVGKRIKEDVLYSKRAEYGKQVVINLSIKLAERYGSGWSEKSLRHCLRAAETFSEEDIVSDDSIEYEGRIYKLSPFVGTFMPEEQHNISGSFQGAKYFSYNGKVLDEIRKEKERESLL